jgi:hypothetical protein
LYVFGGLDSTGSSTSDVEAYDPATNAWTVRAPLPKPGYELAGGVAEHDVFALGGQNNGGTVESYDPNANVWTTQTPLPKPRGREAFGARNVGGVLYAMGGITEGGTFINTVEAFTPGSNTSENPALDADP